MTGYRNYPILHILLKYLYELRSIEKSRHSNKQIFTILKFTAYATKKEK